MVGHQPMLQTCRGPAHARKTHSVREATRRQKMKHTARVSSIWAWTQPRHSGDLGQRAICGNTRIHGHTDRVSDRLANGLGFLLRTTFVPVR
jgi:hypothetical protein